MTCVQQHLPARAVTRSQNTAMRRENARFCEDGRCKYLPKTLGSAEFNGLTEVYMLVSMGAVALQRDVMNRN